MKNFFTLLSFSLLISSCAFHHGNMTGNASISDANFNMVDFAIGTASSTYVFGIGGLKADGLVLEAKRNLYLNHPLKKGPAFANITVDFKRAYYILFSKTKVTISADIVDFNNTPADTTFEEFNKKVTEGFTNTYGNFNRGDSIMYRLNNKLIEAKIIGISENEVIIRFKGPSNQLKSKKVNLNSIFAVEFTKGVHSFGGFSVGDQVIFEPYWQDQAFSGVIIGINNQNVLLKYLANNKSKETIVSIHTIIKPME